jgi:hypothetical protein
MQCELNFLSDCELDAVAGGRMNTGGQQLINKDQRGVPGSGAPKGNIDWPSFAAGAIGGLIVGIAIAA